MTVQIDLPLVNSVLLACERAGRAVMQVYDQPSSAAVRYKADDSPITVADEQANAILTSLLPQLPVLSEDGEIPPLELRSQWPQFWLIDPLDGTREFIERTGEFTVNVALVDQGRPVLGAIYAPVSQQLYWGGMELGAFKRENGIDKAIQVRCEEDRLKRFILVQSRRHGAQNSDLNASLSGLYDHVQVEKIGSSLKYCLIAEGKADACLREGPTCEWDTAAAQALLDAAGGRFYFQGRPEHVYNARESVLNPHFLAVGAVSGRFRLWVNDFFSSF